MSDKSVVQQVLSSIPAWLLALAVLGVFALLFLSYQSQTPISIGGFHVGFQGTKQPGDLISHENKWNGVFKSVRDDSSEEYLGHETLYVQVNEKGVVVGGSEGVVDDGQNSWTQSGYTVGGILSLSYRSTGRSTGVGTYVLREKDPNTYLGHWEGTVFRSKVVKCPYVLSKDSIQAIKSRWSSFLSTPCYYLDLSKNTMNLVVEATPNKAN